MLFDLRGRGRRRTVQVIYLSLALLMGGGLVLFGIGGETQGGLFDAFSEQGDDGTGAIQQRVERAQAAVDRSPRRAAAWADLAQAQFQFAGVGQGYDEATRQFTREGRSRLQAARRAWQRHLALAGERPNAQVAALMVNALTALNRLDEAVRAQEIVAETRDPAFGTFATLATLAYQAGQTRKGDLAADRALELAPEDLRPSLREQLDAAKQQATRQQLEGATGGAGGGGSGGSGAGALP